MSIQTEINRLASAKAAIKTAIEGKGVTVPNGTILDGFASLIDGIEAGGGGGCTSGTFTVTEETYRYTIMHGLGKTPEVFYLGHINTHEHNPIAIYSIVGIYLSWCKGLVYAISSAIGGSPQVSFYERDITTKPNSTGMAHSIGNLNTESATVGSYNSPLSPFFTYYWFAM